MRLVSIFLLLFCCCGNRAVEEVTEDELEKSLKELEVILDDLRYIEEEEEKNDIDADNTDTPWMEPCILREEAEMDEGQTDFQEVVLESLDKWNYCLKKWMAHVAYAQWDYVTDLTEEHKNKSTEASVMFSKWHRQLSRNAQHLYKDLRLSNLDTDTIRQVRLLAQDSSPREDKDVKDRAEIQESLEEIYSTAKVEGKALEPDLEHIIANSRDPQKLLSAWKGWRDETGPKMREKYTEFIRLSNKGATDNNHKDYSEAWLEEQFDETDNLEEIAADLWESVLPLYKELHAYVRRKLYHFYKEKFPDYSGISEKGGIPAHLLGNMWAQNWENIYDIVKPYPEIEEPDYNKVMQEQGYTVDKLFSMAEEFYTSIGMFPMTKKFNDNSMKVKPPPEEHREVVCHASAEDFLTKDDFRIKMCTKIDIEDFETIHHEMGHIEYFMAYENQPAVYRAGVNSAFHEAVGDTISLSVMSRKHLKTIGLLDKDSSALSRMDQVKSDINFLMKRALFKIAFLPFGYLIDKWRWGVFRGDIKEEEYNRKWWDLRLEYQGIVAPVERSEADFDPGAKFHIPSNSPYICYFISFINQFQFYEAMCNAAGHKGELYNCDFYNSENAGDLLRNALSLGKSVPWPQAMKKLTGSSDISTDSILKYFELLHIWLKRENEMAAEGKYGKTFGGQEGTVGWEGETIRWKDK